MNIPNVLKKKINILLIPAIIFGISIPFVYKIYLQKYNVPSIFKAGKIDFTPQPPSQSISGTVSSMTGVPKKTPRGSSDLIDVRQNDIFQIGEDIETDSTSTLELDFKNKIRVSVNADSTVSLVNLIPEDLVFNQSKGNATYTVMDSSTTISVRSFRLLFNLNTGSAYMQVDPDTEVIMISVLNGSGKAAYVDNDNNTQIVDVIPGRSVIFNRKDKKIESKPTAVF